MSKIRNQIKKLLIVGATALLGALGFSSCRSAQLTKTPPPKKPTIPKRDTIRPPYGEVIAMYGTPYRRFEEKESVPHGPRASEGSPTVER